MIATVTDHGMIATVTDHEMIATVTDHEMIAAMTDHGMIAKNHARENRTATITMRNREMQTKIMGDAPVKNRNDLPSTMETFQLGILPSHLL
jgi:hypothetical protein